MSQIKGRNTKPEMVVRSMVHRLGYRYRLHDRKLPGRPDLVFPRLRKIVFVHGCFWHMHDCPFGRVVPKTNYEFWQNKREGNVARDKKNLTALRDSGWNVLIIWECQVRYTENLNKILLDFLNS